MQASTIITTDGLRLTAAVSTRVPEDAEPGVWNSVVAWSPPGFACDEAVATIGKAVSVEVGAASSEEGPSGIRADAGRGSVGLVGER